MQWEGKGRAVLVKSSTAVDKGSKGKFSGSSFYYGSSSLYYLTADGSFECAVPLEKEGPVQDVGWVPGNMQFVVLYGFMPAQGTLFDHKCKPLFTYGTGYRNTITWSPSGRYVALCGFGNLPGDIEFWDRKKGAEGRVGLTKNDATVSAGFSPCSKYFLCASTFPRLRVQNNYRIWNLDGSLLCSGAPLACLHVCTQTVSRTCADLSCLFVAFRRGLLGDGAVPGELAAGLG